MKKDVYRTSQVAAICNISQQTVIRCCDTDKLKHFKIPGSKHRRIPHEGLIEFMESHNIPIPKELK